MYCTRSKALLELGRWPHHGSRLAGRDLNGLVPPRSSIRPFRSSLTTPLKSFPELPRNPYPQPQFQNAPYPPPQFPPYPGQTYTQTLPKPPRGRFIMGVLFGVVAVIGLAQFVKEPQELEDLKRLKEGIEIMQEAGLQSPHHAGLDWKEEPLSLHAASMKLRLGEFTSSHVGKVVVRTDALGLPSNAVFEDFMSLTGNGLVKERDRTEGDNKIGWNFWGIYDGHAGPKTAEILEYFLVPHVIEELSLLPDAELETLASPHLLEVALTSLAAPGIDAAVKTAFTRLDDAIVFNALNALRDATSTTEALTRIAPARSGSCALVAMFDPDTFNLHVACTGDSRAVLGRSSATKDGRYGSWTAVPLSEDQTGFNKSEYARVSAEHPGENEILDQSTGRLLGLAVTRAFGDCRWKWPAEALEDCRDRLWGQKPRPNYKSPPYLTAEPVVTSTKVQKGDFLILASDGFWDLMSSEDAVKCVEIWYQARERGELGAAYQRTNRLRENEPLPQEWKATPADFVVEEHHVATHLAKNALGGSRRDLFRSAMTVGPPDSRNIRDDISLQVIFFDGPAYNWLPEEERKKLEADRKTNPDVEVIVVSRGPNRFPNEEV